MPRTARVALPALLYHVVCRGNNRQWVFNDEEDFAKYVDLLGFLGRYRERDRFRLHHWVLMNNHLHLLLEPGPQCGLSKTMQGLALAYTLWHHRKYRRVGHLWQDRFRSFVVERDSYLLECGRYIERNPLRAGLVADPAAYRWSSYRVYASGAEDGLTESHGIYHSLGRDAATRQTAYREYVLAAREREEEELRQRQAQGVAGGDEYAAEVRSQVVAGRRRPRGRPKK